MSEPPIYERRDLDQREARYYSPPYCDICGGAHDEKRHDEWEDDDDD